MEGGRQSHVVGAVICSGERKNKGRELYTKGFFVALGGVQTGETVMAERCILFSVYHAGVNFVYPTPYLHVPG